MKITISVSAGTDDPTRATLGMVAAKAAREQGHDVLVWLQGEAAIVANRNVYPNLRGINMPPMKDVMDALVEAQVPIWVCEACGKGRGVSPELMVPTARFKNMGEYVAAALERDRTLAF